MCVRSSAEYFTNFNTNQVLFFFLNVMFANKIHFVEQLLLSDQKITNTQYFVNHCIYNENEVFSRKKKQTTNVHGTLNNV